MRVGDSALFTESHYEAHRGVAPPHLCELVVHCLELVAMLSRSGLSYRFKGATRSSSCSSARRGSRSTWTS